jgi:signal transduction histidine kinase/HD-like signal output (HDOD) protein
VSDVFPSRGPQAAPLSLEQLQAVLSGLDVLGSGPAVADRAIALAQLAQQASNRFDACRQLQRLFQADPALAFNLLGLAASRQAGVWTIDQALQRLGDDSLSDLALSALGDPEAGACAGFHHHSLAVALAAEAIAQRASLEVDPPRAYLAGLLHDVGKLALCQAMPRSYQRVRLAAQTAPQRPVYLERRLLGGDHCAAGHLLCQMRRLPEAYAQAAWLHHQPVQAMLAAGATPRLAIAVALANELAHQALGDDDAAAPDVDRPLELAAGLGLDQAFPRQLAEELPSRLQQTLAGLHLADEPSPAALERRRGEALTTLGQRNRRMHADLSDARPRSRALGLVQSLARKLRSRSSSYDVLAAAAEMFAAVLEPGGNASAPMAAYAIDRSAGRATVIRCDGSQQPAWRWLGLRKDLDDMTAPTAVGPSRGVVEQLLADAPGLDDWLNPPSGFHVPIRSSQHWVGGVFLAGQPDPEALAVLGSLADLAGLALSLVQSRSQAAQLNDQLLGASQIMAAAQEALVQTQMLAAVGQMAAGAGHEMNNPLAIISGKAQLMRAQAASEEDRQTWDAIVQQAQRLSDILTELMELASPPPPRPSDILPDELLGEVKSAFLTSGHPQVNSVRVDIEMGEGVPSIRADRDQLRAALLEAVVNAANAAEGPVCIVLGARQDVVNRAVLLTVRDDGPGMDAQTLQRAFAPFFSLQRAGRRRGLGLPKARRHVANSGGRMWIRSRKGRGACVTYQLPAAQ